VTHAAKGVGSSALTAGQSPQLLGILNLIKGVPPELFVLDQPCGVDATGHVVREAKITSEPEALTAWLKGLGYEIVRIGLEAGPLSQWLYCGMKTVGLPVELLETRHVRTAFNRRT
jgi:hypothetical protein